MLSISENNKKCGDLILEFKVSPLESFCVQVDCGSGGDYEPGYYILTETDLWDEQGEKRFWNVFTCGHGDNFRDIFQGTKAEAFEFVKDAGEYIFQGAQEFNVFIEGFKAFVSPEKRERYPDDPI